MFNVQLYYNIYIQISFIKEDIIMSNNEPRNINFMRVGARIQQYRVEAKLTQEQLAEKIGISQKHLSRIEQGYHNTTFDTIISLAKVLNVPTDAFAADLAVENKNIFLRIIKKDIEHMSKKQLDMLLENIAVIKKFNF